MLQQLVNLEQLLIGGGGWLMNHISVPGGLKFCYSDVFGLYAWSVAKDKWISLTTADRFPAGAFTGYLKGPPEGDNGVFAFAVAPSDHSKGYLCFAGKVWKMTGGNSIDTIAFTATNFVLRTDMDSNNQRPQTRMCTGKIAIDPRDPDHVIVGTNAAAPGGCAWRSTNGMDFSVIASIPAPYGQLPNSTTPPTTNPLGGALVNGDYYMHPDTFAFFTRLNGAFVNISCAQGVMGIMFDPGSAADTTSVPGKTLTSRVYLYLCAHGYFTSSNAGNSFSLMSGFPAQTQTALTVSNAVMRNGKLWVCAYQAAPLDPHLSYILMSNAGGAFVDKSPQPSRANGNPMVDIAFDPLVSTRVCVIFDGGGLQECTINGSDVITYGTFFPALRASDPADAVWQSVTEENFMTTSRIQFSPDEPNVLEFSEGLGFWTQLRSAAQIGNTNTWVPKSRGIENVVAMYPAMDNNDRAVLCVQDRRAFVRKFDESRKYPVDHIGVGTNDNIAIAYGRRPHVLEATNDVSIAIKTAKSGILVGDTYFPFKLSQQPYTDLAEFVITRKKVNGKYSAIVIPLNGEGPPKYCDELTVDSNGIVGTWVECVLSGKPAPGAALNNWLNQFHGYDGFNLRKSIICQDLVNPAKVRMLHSDGVYKNSNYGQHDAWTLTAASTPPIDTFWNCKFKPVPFIEDACVLTYGNDGTGLYYSDNGGASFTSMSSVYSMGEIIDISFGPRFAARSTPLCASSAA